MLAETTGRRIEAIRRLARFEICFDLPSIVSRAAFGKRHTEQWVPTPDRWWALARLPAQMGDRAKKLAVKDVAAAGGWKDVTTLLTCYQHADEATMSKEIASHVKLVGLRSVRSLEKR